MNHESFYQEKESLQLHRFQFLEINSLMAENIKNKFSKQNSHKKIAQFGNNLFILENCERSGYEDSFS